MRRREFIAAFLGTAIARPLPTRAQPTRKLPTIGFVGASNPSLAAERVAAFTQQLRDLGWVDGSTVIIEYRWEEGHFERAAEMFAELVGRNVDVIVTHGTENVIAAKQVTPVIPIVFAVAGDPVGTGLVASLARPGGNVTGLSIQATDLAGKRLELLREVVPSLRRLAILANVDNHASMLELQDVQAAAQKLGIVDVKLEFHGAEDIPAVLETFKGAAEALYVCADAMVTTQRARINAMALSARLPTMEDNREFIAAKGLMSYGPNFPDLFRRSAGYIDKILRGAKPADLPVEQPTKFDLVINLSTAKTIGVTIPQTLLATADEVIE